MKPLVILMFFAAILFTVFGVHSVLNQPPPPVPAPTPTKEIIVQQTPTPIPKLETFSYTVSAKRPWTKTTRYIESGNEISFMATGEVNTCPNQNDAAYKWVGPDGWGHVPVMYHGYADQPNHLRPQTQIKPILGNDTSYMCLIGRIGSGPPCYIGSEKKHIADSSGYLFLGVNESTVAPLGEPSNEGSVYWEENLGNGQIMWIDNLSCRSKQRV